MFFNNRIQFRLGKARFIRLVMPVSPVTEQIDKNIRVISLPVFHGQLDRVDHRLRIIGIHVENR